ncbi:acyltransferase family protein [Caulobacter sp. Root487D2Y]|uniref:acyltransferase family protein n=1 Tax=Caulobacter sp. Root487D2Y TaxID=1736547 RepID=UPI000AB1AB87|nr:acyltransferase [Caulobacter sp. Root487D2Y]
MRYNRPELDGLRLAAFGLVLAFHLPDYLPLAAEGSWLRDALWTGAFGVPVFFLLSAFLITELLTRERDATGKIGVGAFYGRRILRIWPLYFAVLLGLTALDHLRPGFGPARPDQFAAFALFYGNWHVALKGWVAGPVDPLWSISVEEQFYLLVPLVLAWGGRRAMGWLAVVALVAAYGTIWLYARHPVAGDNGQWTNGLVQYQFFAAGCLLSILLKGRVPSWAWPTRLALALAGLACWLVAVRVCGVRSWDPQSPSAILALAGWGLILAGTVAVFLSVLGVRADAVPAPIVRGGRISYGLYMFHAFGLSLVFWVLMPALDRYAPGLSTSVPGRAMGVILAVALIVLLAQLSFRFLETPFLKLKDRLAVVGR